MRDVRRRRIVLKPLWHDVAPTKNKGLLKWVSFFHRWRLKAVALQDHSIVTTNSGKIVKKN